MHKRVMNRSIAHNEIMESIVFTARKTIYVLIASIKCIPLFLYHTVLTAYGISNVIILKITIRFIQFK